MKKLKIIIPVLLLCIVTGAVIAYFAYGSTLIDITSEESINENLAVDPEQPITILATAENGDYFGIVYSDPTDGDDSAFHFRYITKAKLYKNKYRNVGGYSLFYDDYLCYNEVNTDEENRTTSDVFIYSAGRTSESENDCSVFKYYIKDSYIIPEETSPQQITEKYKKLADSYKKLDEFTLPDDDAFIIAKSYDIDDPDDNIDVINESVSEQDMKQRVLDETDDVINELF